MTDKGKLIEQTNRGDEAGRLMSHPLITEFFDRVYEAAVSAWRDSDVDESELRERAYFRMLALEDLRVCFQETMRTGEFARKQLMHRRETENES